MADLVSIMLMMVQRTTIWKFVQGTKHFSRPHVGLFDAAICAFCIFMLYTFIFLTMIVFQCPLLLWHTVSPQLAPFMLYVCLSYVVCLFTCCSPPLYGDTIKCIELKWYETTFRNHYISGQRRDPIHEWPHIWQNTMKLFNYSGMQIMSLKNRSEWWYTEWNFPTVWMFISSLLVLLSNGN